MQSSEFNNGAALTGNITTQAASDPAVINQSGLKFWQQLQTESENSLLPVGQELAAFVGPMLPKELSTNQDQLDAESIEFDIDFELSNINLSGLDLAEGNTEQQADVFAQSPQGLQYLESLRNAQPHMQHYDGFDKIDIDPTLVQTASQSNGLVQAGALPVNESLEESKSPLTGYQTLTSQQASTSQFMHRDIGNKIPSQTSSLLAQNNDMVSEGSEGLMDLDTIDSKLSQAQSIHEKPITLTAAKESTQMTNLQAISSEGSVIEDTKQISGDLIQGSMKDSQLGNKSLALNGSLPAANQNVDKPQSSFSKLEVPPNHPQWNDQVAKRVMIMANESMQSARIQLDPPELGALEIKIKVQHDQVSVSFGSNHQVVRDALEAQAPRLREMLDQQGINLADVDVSEHSNQQGENSEQGNSQEGESNDVLSNEEINRQESMISMESDSLVDYFA
ncbi:hypothetical protein NBRC116188_16180 [Oceaniserpentilla sp. 4NH20-0058]